MGTAAGGWPECSKPVQVQWQSAAARCAKSGALSQNEEQVSSAVLLT